MPTMKSTRSGGAGRCDHRIGARAGVGHEVGKAEHGELGLVHVQKLGFGLAE